MSAPVHPNSIPANDVKLAPPKADPFTPAALKQYDGTDASKPVYVAVKGTVFDVSNKRDAYGPGGNYHVYAGKDGSRGLALSSLEPADAVSRYSDLDQDKLKKLDEWYQFFEKRYNIVGKVQDA
ncbi:hypothetical protein BOTBODRAFT_187541 [Botryobasidium botryosum FD-172 SS1]|uniref:Cytochrome b5 heme-binding domain-containing protein n=1 Tax=Botryobasidium botryosum (strain FD-172 SS1) TaxID=930990 RepID=A0A067MK92_BOTB1|nr:hypothetical protein BOTBODRAFT_187541 [Botryobasidium botryosum FD-172 SS1]